MSTTTTTEPPTTLPKLPDSIFGTAPTKSPAAPAVPAPGGPPTDIKQDGTTKETPQAAEQMANIPTDIHDDKGPSGKTPQQFRDERLAAKTRKEQEIAERLGVDGLKSDAEQAKAEAMRVAAEMENLKTRHAEIERRNLELEELAKKRAQEDDDLRQQHFDAFKGEIRPDTDEDYMRAYNGMAQAFNVNLPEQIPAADGTQKSFIPETFLNNPAVANQSGNIMAYYRKARQEGDAKTMERAVSAMAQLMGADVKVSDNPDEERLLETGSSTYAQINSAMRAALPHFDAMQARGQHLREEAPKIIQERLTAREKGIRGDLEKGVYLPIDVATERLVQSPTDAAALISVLVNDNPEWKEMAERTIAGLTPALARMGQLQLPPPRSNKPEDIAAHRQDIQRLQGNLGAAMKDAVVGRMAGHIIASMRAEIIALRSRADGASVATNPGRHTDDTAVAPKTPINTEI